MGGPEPDGGSSALCREDRILQATTEPGIDDHCIVGLTPFTQDWSICNRLLCNLFVNDINRLCFHARSMSTECLQIREHFR